MSFGDLFKGKENNQLKERIRELENMLTPEMRESLSLRQKIEQQRAELQRIEEQIAQSQSENERTKNNVIKEIEEIKIQIEDAKANLVEINEEALMQTFGLYKPHYAFANSTEYKEELTRVRAQQKEHIKAGTAATGSKNWTVNGNAREGAKMIRDMQKLLIRAFNCECDDAVEHVKFNNIEAAEKRINTSYEAISKLGSVCDVSITNAYRKLKIAELHLAYEYQVEKQKEKEELRQLRAEERERAKLEKEIAEERKKIEKEKKHYANALKKVEEQLIKATADERKTLEEKRKEYEEQLDLLDESMKKVDYREANQRAGYVYIISNIGAFGEGIYKIGMTRRLDPMDRIDELGDASVPYDFDVHALIFTDDAPGLETALHKAFENRKLNMINTRREFFRVSLDEIKEVVKCNFDKTVDFVDVPMAEQYRQSELIRKQV